MFNVNTVIILWTTLGYELHALSSTLSCRILRRLASCLLLMIFLTEDLLVGSSSLLMFTLEELKGLLDSKCQANTVWKMNR